jgi:hypothetical protein
MTNFFKSLLKGKEPEPELEPELELQFNFGSRFRLDKTA